MNIAKPVFGLVFAALATGAFAQSLNVAGSTTLQKRLIEPGAGALNAATGIDIRVDGVGTGQGMLALFDGKVPAAAVSETLPASVAAAMKAARTLNRSVNDLKIPLNLQFHELAKDRIVVIVNKVNPIKALTKEQLKAIHTGRVRNWADVGGANLPITVVTSHTGSATRSVFQREIMGNAEYVPGAVIVSSTADELKEVSKDRGGIGAVSIGFFSAAPGRARLVEAPELSRALALVTVGAPQPVVQKTIDFYRSQQGQKWFK